MTDEQKGTAVAGIGGGRSRLERHVYLVAWGTCATLIEATSEETARTEWARRRSERFRRRGIDPANHGVELRVRLADEHLVKAFHEARTARQDAQW